MKGPLGQFRTGVDRSFVHAENFLVERNGQLRNRPAVKQTALANAVLQPKDKYLSFIKNSKTYHLVYDPFLYTEWGDSGDGFSNKNTADFFTDPFNGQMYSSNVRPGTPLSELYVNSIITSERGLGYDLESLDDLNTWNRLGYTQGELWDAWNKLAHFNTYNLINDTRVAALDGVEHRIRVADRIRSNGANLDIQTMLRLLATIMTFPRITHSSLFYSRFLLYQEIVDADNISTGVKLLASEIFRYPFVDENKQYFTNEQISDATRDALEVSQWPLPTNVKTIRESLEGPWDSLSYEASQGPKYTVLTESTGRLPVLLIDIDDTADAEKAIIFDQRLLYFGCRLVHDHSYSLRCDSWVTQEEYTALNMDIKRGGEANRPDIIEAGTTFDTPAKVKTEFERLSAGYVSSGATSTFVAPTGFVPELKNDVFGASTSLASFSADNNDAFARDTSEGMRLHASPILGATAADIAHTGGLAFTPFFNGDPIIRLFTFNPFEQCVRPFQRTLPDNSLAYSPISGILDFDLTPFNGNARISWLTRYGDGGATRGLSVTTYSFINPEFGLNLYSLPTGSTGRERQPIGFPTIFSPFISGRAYQNHPVVQVLPRLQDTENLSGNLLAQAMNNRNTRSAFATAYIVKLLELFTQQKYNPWKTNFTRAELLQDTFFSNAYLDGSEGNRFTVRYGEFLVGDRQGFRAHGYNSWNYFTRSEYFSSRYILASPNRQRGLIAATHSVSDTAFFRTITTESRFSFDSYFRLSDAAGRTSLTLTNYGFWQRLTSAQGTNILYMVFRTPNTPPLVIGTSIGEAMFNNLSLEGIRTAAFAGLSSPPETEPVTIYAARFRITNDKQVVNYIQSSVELSRSIYTAVTPDISDYINVGIDGLEGIPDGGRIFVLVGSRLFAGIVMGQGNIVWTELVFSAPIVGISVTAGSNELTITHRSSVVTLDFNEHTPIESGVPLSLSLPSPAAVWLTSEGLTEFQQDLLRFNYNNGMLLGQFEGNIGIGTMEGRPNQQNPHAVDLIKFGGVELKSYKDAVKFDFEGRRIIINSAFFEVTE